MLEYNHHFNTEDLLQPFHIHQLLSDTKKVSFYLNDQYQGELSPNEFKPNTHQGFTFYKYISITNEMVFNLLVSGSLATYDSKTNDAIFNNNSLVYIKNQAGLRLYRNPDTGTYSWSSTLRSRFFYNPYYFDSEFLWRLRFGTLPTGVNCNRQWPAIEETLFLSSTFEYEGSWLGDKEIPMVEPLVIDHYNRDNSGEVIELKIEEHLDIQHVLDGDTLRFNNGREEIEIQVKNSGDMQLSYDNTTRTSRPIVHVPIQATNPNELHHYAKGMDRQSQEVVSLTIRDTNIQFTIIRT